MINRDLPSGCKVWASKKTLRSRTNNGAELNLPLTGLAILARAVIIRHAAHTGNWGHIKVRERQNIGTLRRRRKGVLGDGFESEPVQSGKRKMGFLLVGPNASTYCTAPPKKKKMVSNIMQCYIMIYHPKSTPHPPPTPRERLLYSALAHLNPKSCQKYNIPLPGAKYKRRQK